MRTFTRTESPDAKCVITGGHRSTTVALCALENVSFLKVKCFEGDSSHAFSQLKNHKGLHDFGDLCNNSIASPTKSKPTGRGLPCKFLGSYKKQPDHYSINCFCHVDGHGKRCY